MAIQPKKDCNRKKTRPLAMTYVFGSFFGAFMVSIAFAYFNFKFTEYRFIDFNKIAFFDQRKLFIPTADKYIVLIYSTKSTPNINSLGIDNSKYKILAIDIHQGKSRNNENYINLKSSINNILQVIQKFNIYTVPSTFLIEKNNKTLYKQDSSINILKL